SFSSIVHVTAWGQLTDDTSAGWRTKMRARARAAGSFCPCGAFTATHGGPTFSGEIATCRTRKILHELAGSQPKNPADSTLTQFYRRGSARTPHLNHAGPGALPRPSRHRMIAPKREPTSFAAFLCAPSISESFSVPSLPR